MPWATFKVKVIVGWVETESLGLITTVKVPAWVGVPDRVRVVSVVVWLIPAGRPVTTKA